MEDRRLKPFMKLFSHLYHCFIKLMICLQHENFIVQKFYLTHFEYALKQILILLMKFLLDVTKILFYSVKLKSLVFNKNIYFQTMMGHYDLPVILLEASTAYFEIQEFNHLKSFYETNEITQLGYLKNDQLKLLI